jgi:hypothetical protein
MEAIVTDSRHRNLVVVREDAIGVRRFQNWSVGFLPTSSEFATDDASASFLRSLTSRI